MEISAANLTALFTGFDIIFQRAFNYYPSYFADIASVTRSQTKRQEYPWLKRTIAMREWLGERVLQALEVNDFTILNRHFEATESIDRDDLEDDIQGVYEPVISELGRITKVHPDLMIFGMIKAALANIDNPSGAAYDMGGISVPVPVAYDGLTLFSANGHPVGPAGNTLATYPNINTSGGSNPYWILIDGSRAVRPLLYQLRKPYEAVHMAAPTDEWVFSQRKYRYGVDGRDAAGPGLWQLIYASNADLSTPANYDAARTAMRSIKNDNGLPFGAWANSKGRFLVVPPSLEGTARRLLHSEFGPGEGGNAATPTTNIWRNDAELIVSEYLE